MHNPIQSLLALKTSRLHTVDVTANVSEAVKVMNDNKVGSVIVLEQGRLIGIFTERDVLCRVVATERNPRKTSIDQVMTKKVFTVQPDTTVEETMALITDPCCRHLPVLDQDQLIGMISSGDVTRWIAQANQTEADMLRSYINGNYG